MSVTCSKVTETTKTKVGQGSSHLRADQPRNSVVNIPFFFLLGVGVGFWFFGFLFILKVVFLQVSGNRGAGSFWLSILVSKSDRRKLLIDCRWKIPVKSSDWSIS